MEPGGALGRLKKLFFMNKHQEFPCSPLLVCLFSNLFDVVFLLDYMPRNAQPQLLGQILAIEIPFHISWGENLYKKIRKKKKNFFFLFFLFESVFSLFFS